MICAFTLCGLVTDNSRRGPCCIVTDYNHRPCDLRCLLWWVCTRSQINTRWSVVCIYIYIYII